ncbi:MULTISPECIES: hypothetical protein [unclassified Diaminobutyricimonas]|uniref:hypothetical protein n=1 Tax=unclassified Diaminobutyricimonas TaxID=2643261 RepID=UPI0012F4E58D|nr:MULTISPECIES: hypothetical protein [unclassified Diaminobutyricimonas]
MDEYQTEPVEDGAMDATNEERLAGVAQQVASDVSMDHTHESVLTMLRERCGETGVQATDEQLQALAQRIVDAVQKREV